MNKTLLIMAAGMGSRYNGLKQIDPVGPNNEFIIDYSIYDAIRNGFNKVVFIIKEENYNIFKETIGNRIENKIHVEYVFQKLDNLPKGYSTIDKRIKPWGTAHAILCAKNVINEPFVVINSDDFYGNDAYMAISKFIDNNKDNMCGIVGYDVINTLTKNGSVKRGVCQIKDNYLVSIDEAKIEKKNNIIEAISLENDNVYVIDENTKVSMNMMCFKPDIFDYLEENFIRFLNNNDSNKLLQEEFLIPTVLENGIKENKFKVYVINTNAKWAGVTYKEDKEELVNYINSLIDKNQYPRDLWND